ncbi:MAG: ROK family protein, partial [Cellvibrionaceae bacterium]|nr:ROK family protein [Cellvibrionaceae bacterium]
DTMAQKALADYRQLLALALANVINILDPDTIVLGGGLSQLPELAQASSRALASYVFSDEVLCQIKLPQLGDSAGVFGAAWLTPQQLSA